MGGDKEILNSKETQKNTFEYDPKNVSNYIVKYDNILGDIPLSGFTKRQLDLLFTLLVKLKGKNDDHVLLDFTELKKISAYTQSNDKTFVKDLIETNTKIQKIHASFWDEEKYTSFILFPTFTIDTKERTLQLNVNKDYTFLINNLEGTFTRFRLKQFLSLKKTYSKILFKKLMQFKHSGRYYVRIEDFKKLMDIPASYKTKEISKAIIKPSIEEINVNGFLKNLRFEKEFKGRKITKLAFYFDPIPKGMDGYENDEEDNETNVSDYRVFGAFRAGNKKSPVRTEKVPRDWEDDFIFVPNIIESYKTMIRTYENSDYLEFVIKDTSDVEKELKKIDLDRFISNQITEITLYNKKLGLKEKEYGIGNVGVKETYIESTKKAKVAKRLAEEITETDYQELNILWESIKQELENLKESLK